MERKIAILSNTNVDFIKRMLRPDLVVMEAEGYGNVFEQMLDEDSSYQHFAPEETFLILDLMELLEHDLLTGREKISAWFSDVRSCIREGREYFISDAYLWGTELSVIQDGGLKDGLEAAWREQLRNLCGTFPNVHVFPYREIIDKMGEELFFSLKSWYLGKILYTYEAQKRMADRIRQLTVLAAGTDCLAGGAPKKVLLLDLDDTLWGGLAGEADHAPVRLSEDHEGLAYKNLQRVIAWMQKQGVVLGIVSKNNEADALEILEHHPHCVLRPESFAVRKINWRPKHENIEEIAGELNLGLDSMVFWDDNPAERQLIAELLPQVTVPEFPKKPEELAPAMAEIYQNYFRKLEITEEDRRKTEQYQANAKRRQLQGSMDYDAYLRKLGIVITREDPGRNLERFAQLVNKTNQFNLTAKRYETMELQRILKDPKKRVFLYRIEDCFGDNGIVAAAIVDVREPGGSSPCVEELVMSCRVMGRRIEHAIVEDVENSLLGEGYEDLYARYSPTAKNKPVETLYDKLGYRLLRESAEGEKEYKISLANRPKRVYYAEIKGER